ncbi:hypothetical protein BY996DRAFT_8204602, partial [Phakopsora pachyrhizi]
MHLSNKYTYLDKFKSTVSSSQINGTTSKFDHLRGSTKKHSFVRNPAPIPVFLVTCHFDDDNNNSNNYDGSDEHQPIKYDKSRLSPGGNRGVSSRQRRSLNAPVKKNNPTIPEKVAITTTKQTGTSKPLAKTIRPIASHLKNCDSNESTKTEPISQKFTTVKGNCRSKLDKSQYDVVYKDLENPKSKIYRFVSKKAKRDGINLSVSTYAYLRNMKLPGFYERLHWKFYSKEMMIKDEVSDDEFLNLESLSNNYKVISSSVLEVKNLKKSNQVVSIIKSERKTFSNFERIEKIYDLDFGIESKDEERSSKRHCSELSKSLDSLSQKGLIQIVDSEGVQLRDETFIAITKKLNEVEVCYPKEVGEISKGVLLPEVRSKSQDPGSESDNSLDQQDPATPPSETLNNDAFDELSRHLGILTTTNINESSSENYRGLMNESIDILISKSQVDEDLVKDFSEICLIKLSKKIPKTDLIEDSLKLDQNYLSKSFEKSSETFEMKRRRLDDDDDDDDDDVVD